MLASRLRELDELNTEISNLSTKLRKLRSQRSTIEADVVTMLKSKNLSAVKHGGKAILLESKETRGRLTEKQRRAKTLQVLEEAGVDNPETVLNELTEARRGSPETKHRLRIQKKKKKK